MRVVFFDRSETLITKTQAENIKKMIEADVKWLEINGELYRPSAIMAIRNGGVTSVDVLAVEKRIAPPDYRGEYSPAKERIREMFQKSGE